MEGDPDGDTDVLLRHGVREGDRPWQVALLPPAAPGGKAAEPPDRLPDRDGRSGGVRDRPEVEVPNPKEDDGGDDRADEAAVENAAGAEELEERPAFQEVGSSR